MADSAPGNYPSDEVNQTDSDLDDGDTVLSRGWPRSIRGLEKHGFQPVWSAVEGYPHKDIPEEIAELLDEDGSCRSLQFIGPLRSIAWLAGLDELVEAIDSSAYTIEDSMETVPLGAGLMWPAERYIDEGKIPSFIANKICRGYKLFPSQKSQLDNLTTQHVSPPGVSENPTLFPGSMICETNRLSMPSGEIFCMKEKADKNLSRLETKIRRQSGGKLEAGRLWFRAMSLPALRSTLSFFITQTNTVNKNNEFGPGFYTSESLHYSLGYIQAGGGAIMVFKDPNLLQATVWQPDVKEWTAWVAKWIGLPVAIAKEPAPPGYSSADFIHGPIRDSQEDSRRRNIPIQSEIQQLVAVSYDGCGILADALYLIIFVDPA